MPTGWRLCVAAILTTGSISSTSGAETTLPICNLAAPPGAEEAIAGVSGKGRGQIPYREEIWHPAFAEPVIAEGTVEVTDDDRFIRRQTKPVLEIAEVSEDAATMRLSDDGTGNVVQVPEDIRPVIAAMRMMSTGDAARLGEIFNISYSQVPWGWRVDLTPKDSSLAVGWLAMIGCGTAPRQMLVGGTAGEKRVMTFDFPG